MEEGLDVSSFENDSGDVYEEHIHENDEIIVIAKGQMKFAAKNKEEILGAGDRIELKAGTRHTAEVVGNEKVVALKGVKVD